MPGVMVGHQDGSRTIGPIRPTSRRRCTCCLRRATHYGLADGMVLMSGCEWYVSMWVRNPSEAFAMTKRRAGLAAPTGSGGCR